MIIICMGTNWSAGRPITESDLKKDNTTFLTGAVVTNLVHNSQERKKSKFMVNSQSFKINSESEVMRLMVFILIS